MAVWEGLQRLLNRMEPKKKELIRTAIIRITSNLVALRQQPLQQIGFICRAARLLLKAGTFYFLPFGAGDMLN